MSQLALILDSEIKELVDGKKNQLYLSSSNEKVTNKHNLY